jgi:hypothetical protein
VEYRAEHERMLLNLGLAGAAFKKVYFDPALNRQTAVFIPAEDIVMPYGCSGARNAERLTHVMRRTKNDVRKMQVSGFYRDVDLGEPTRILDEIDKKKAEEQGYTLTDEDRFQLLEIQVDYDLPGYEDPDGVALPYVITIDRGTGRCCRYTGTGMRKTRSRSASSTSCSTTTSRASGRMAWGTST